MPKTARTLQAAAGVASQHPARPFKKQKFNVFLVTGDDSLWPLVGADLSGDLILKQLDSVDELLATVPAEQPGIVLWDARRHTDTAGTLATLAQHSSRFALIVLDANGSAGVWTLPLQQRQIVAAVGLPISSILLGKALESAREEVNARTALLGDGRSGEPPAAGGAPVSAVKKARWLPMAAGAAIVAAAAAVFVLTRHGPSTDRQSPDGAKGATSSAPAAAAPAVVAAGSAPATDEKVDGLIEQAQQAMSDRHFIDPAAGSALALYRDVLLIDPNNGEARQGLQRLAEILISRVQSALDERKFDVALQALETARSIDANDRRLSALDDRIASLRAELGPAQIYAALNAQNFDRATQLIDDAARAKSLPPAKLAQLRDDVRKRSDEFDSTQLLKRVETRLQQDKQHGLGAPAASVAGMQKDLAAARSAAAPVKPDQPQYLDLAQSRLAQGKVLEPDNDNALYYLNQLRGADPKNAALPQLSDAVQEQILERARTALDAGDADRADTLLQQAAALGPSAAVDAMNDRLRQKKAAADAVPDVPEQSLTRLNKLEITYPYAALRANVEGWVELGFTVNPNGTVSNVRVLNASPAHTFEQAGIRAVSKLRYQPVMQDGKAIAVNSQFRAVFRMPK